MLADTIHRKAIEILASSLPSAWYLSHVKCYGVEAGMAQNPKNTNERYTRAGTAIGSLQDRKIKDLAKRHDRILSKVFSK
jgi:hypothetical protein